MKREKIIRKLCGVPAGRFFRVRYSTVVPLKAEYENKGYSLLKIVDTTTRTGVKYQNIRDVLTTSDNSSGATNNWEWEYKNRIKYNTSTKSQYAVFAPIDPIKAHSQSTYLLTDSEGNTTIKTRYEVAPFVIESYFCKPQPKIITVDLAHILWLSIKERKACNSKLHI